MAELQDEAWWEHATRRDEIRRDPIAVLASRGVNVPAETPVEIVREVLRLSYLIWVNGQVIPVDRFHIDPADEGLLFGRGVWESTRTQNGIPWLWPWHLDRLRKTAEVLGMPVAPERLPDANQVTQFVRSLTLQDVVIRLNVSAGRVGQPGLVWMSAALRPVEITSVRLQTRPNPVDKGQPYLLWKTFQYATRLRVGQEAAQAGFDSALLVDSAGNLLEASHANIFVRLPDGWATPAVNGGFLPGTVRQFLLQQSPLPIREQAIPVSALSSITEAFVTNSNSGIVPVTQIDGLPIAIGPETTSLMQWLHPPVAGANELRFVERKTPVR